MDNLVLRPNCLLTKYPLVFISGPRSLFHFEKLGGSLQDFLAAHGYRVFSPILPFRSKALRREVLRKWIEAQSDSSFHFFLSPETETEFGEMLKIGSGSTTTNLARFAETKVIAPLYYRLHQLFCFINQCRADDFEDTLPVRTAAFYDRILDHCVELAENE